MRPRILGQSESGTQVRLEHIHLLDVGQQGGVDAGLETESFLLSLVFLLLLSFIKLNNKKFHLSIGIESVSALGSLNLRLLEKAFSDIVRVDARQVDLGSGGHHVCLVDSFQRDSVNFVGSSHEEEA